MNTLEVLADTGFSIAGVRVGLEGGDSKRLNRVHGYLSDFFIEDSLGDQDKGLTIILKTSPLEPLAGEEVYADENLQVVRGSSTFFLRCGASSCAVYPERGVSECYLGADFEDQSLYAQREFFMLGLLMLLRPQGLYALHACGVQGGGTGALLVGSSGMGKTTTTLNLVRSGWSYLSDDAVLLRERQEGVEALAFRRGFACTEQTLGVLGLERSGRADNLGGKVVIDGAELGTFIPTLQPRVLLFPRLDERSTQLLPLTQTEGLMKLCQHSAGIMTDRAASQRQLELLKRLASRALSFDLVLGPDALEQPDLISRRLEEAL